MQKVFLSFLFSLISIVFLSMFRNISVEAQCGYTDTYTRQEARCGSSTADSNGETAIIPNSAGCVYSSSTQSNTCVALSGACWLPQSHESCVMGALGSGGGNNKTCRITLTQEPSFSWSSCYCNYGAWSNQSCGGGSCTSQEMQRRRTAYGCADQYQCDFDDCGAWVNGACDGGSCTATQRQQTRSCQYNNACRVESQCVADAACVPACNSLGFVSGSVSPGSVAPGGAYTMQCNYGAVVDSIQPVPGSGSCTYVNFTGTTANFNCTAGAATGTFANSCSLVSGTSANSCARTDAINSLIVAPTPPTVGPTNLTAACNAAGTQVNLSWDPVAGATTYPLRFNNAPNVPPATNCDTTNPADWYSALAGECDNDALVGTTYTNLPVETGRTYTWWVHGRNAGGYGPSTSSTFTCNAIVPPVLNPLTQTCSGTSPEISMTWSGSGSFWADVGEDPAFGSFWNKNTGTTTSATAPVGFALYPASSPAMPALTVGQTYYARIWNGVHSNTQSITIDNSCTPPTPTPVASYFKLKNTGFYSLNNIVANAYPPGRTAFDAEDTNSSYLIQGASGVDLSGVGLAVVKTGSTFGDSAAPNNGVSSTTGTPPKGWRYFTDSPPGPIFTPASFILSVQRNKSVTAAQVSSSQVQTATEIGTQFPSAGTYYDNNGGSISDSNLPSSGATMVLFGGNTSIVNSGTGIFNSGAPKPFVMVVDGTLTIDPTVREINGIFIARSFDLGTSALPLKIKGNIASTQAVDTSVRKNADSTKASVFVVFDPTQYINLFDKLSITTSSWQQLQ